MDPESIRTLDDLDVGRSLIEVDWCPWEDDLRTTVGVFGGFERCRDGAWYLIVNHKLTVRMADVVAVRKLPQLQGA